MRGHDTQSGDHFGKRWISLGLSREARQICHEYRHHAAEGMNAAASVALLMGGLRGRNTDCLRSGLIRTFTQAAWFARASEKITFLKKFQPDKFMLGVAAAGIALRAPQLYNVFMSGSTLSRGMAGLVVSALALQVIPPAEHILRDKCRNLLTSAGHLRSVPRRAIDSLSRIFTRVSAGIDHYVYDNPAAKTLLTRGPKLFMCLNAAGSIAAGLLERNWYIAGAGATYLAGAGIVTVSEKYLGHADNAGSHPVYDPGATMIHTDAGHHDFGLH